MSKTTNRSAGPTVLRIVVGIVFVEHGIQKFFSFGVPAVVAFFGTLGIPHPKFFGELIPLVELLCGAALILGFATRVNALILAIEMAVAVIKVHFKNGFFMPMGYEFALTLLAVNISLMLTGGGCYSLDGLIWGGEEPRMTKPLPARAVPAKTESPTSAPPKA